MIVIYKLLRITLAMK